MPDGEEPGFFAAMLPACLRLVACCLALGAWAARGAEKESMPAVDDRWRHVRSPGFEIYSRNGEAEAREILHHLELLRAVFLERFEFVERARLDVTVFHFRSKEDFHAYATEQTAKHGGFAGFYLRGLDRAVISIGPTTEWEQSRPLIFHEYIHHLFRTAEIDPAPWFDEGMAELLASIRPVGDVIEIGHPQPGRIQALREGRLLPLETIFGTTRASPIFRTDTHTGMFYAESWALLHFWYFGESGLQKDAVTRFTRVAGEREQAGANGLREFFRKCFGMDYAEMQRRLERYVESGRYRYGRQPAPVIPAAKTYAARAVPRPEIRVRLAELALRVQRQPWAKSVLLETLEQSHKAGAAPDARLLEALGTAALAEGDPTRAMERWEEALAAGSTNAAIVRELGLLESRSWFQSFDFHYQMPGETAQRLRTRLRRAIDNEPEQSAPYEMLAWVEAFAEKPDIGNVNLVQRRFKTLRQQARTVLALAMVRVRSKAEAEALELLDSLDEFEPDSWTQHAAQIVRTRLSGAGVERAAGAKPSAPPVAPPREALQPRVRVPSVELPEKYSGR